MKTVAAVRLHTNSSIISLCHLSPAIQILIAKGIHRLLQYTGLLSITCTASIVVFSKHRQSFRCMFCIRKLKTKNHWYYLIWNGTNPVQNPSIISILRIVFLRINKPQKGPAVLTLKPLFLLGWQTFLSYSAHSHGPQFTDKLIRYKVNCTDE